jgi:hypothetical protein
MNLSSRSSSGPKVLFILALLSGRFRFWVGLIPCVSSPHGRCFSVPIVPINLGTDDWRPTGWLGIVLAGALWSTLEDATFDADVDHVVSQIVSTVPRVQDEDEDEYGGGGGLRMTAQELRDEFDRLRRSVEEEERLKHNKATKAVVTFNPEEPAQLPSNVPQLPPDFRETETIRWLRDTLLGRGDADDCAKPRCGFWGMGGIGKTVTGLAIARDHNVREFFDQIVWLPLGQTPVMDKLRQLALEQLTGEDMAPDATEEEKVTQLRLAMAGKSVLLCLDDLWETEHEDRLNFIDPATQSRVLISTRVRGLLTGAAAIEVNAPSEEDAISIVMAAAQMPRGASPPSAAREIVKQCGRLPLALGMAGKLILQLGLTDNWDGVSDILREELREHADMSSEQRVIRASLAGLDGSERDKTGVRNLFKLFGLVSACWSHSRVVHMLKASSVFLHAPQIGRLFLAACLTRQPGVSVAGT